MGVARSKLTYANVVATLALFLALGGGAVWAAQGLGKHVVKTNNLALKAVKNKNIAANAVKNKNVAKDAITASKVKDASLTRSELAAGTLAGLQVLDAQANNVQGFVSGPSTGTPIPLAGTTSFVPQAGKSYELLIELAGNPSDVDGAGGSSSCYAWVNVLVNGQFEGYAEISANAAAPPPFNLNSVGSSSAAVGLLTPGQLQTVSALAFTEPGSGCASNTTGNLRIVVVEFG